jgi:large subunit ribosomal protein L29
MKASEIKDLTTKEIEAKIKDEALLLNKKKLNHAISPLENPNELKQSRKSIARLKTELRQREIKNQDN